MSITFSRSMRSLNADGFRRSILGLLLVAVLLGAGVAWFFLARVTLYEVAETARLEVVRAVHPVEAPVSGRVVATHLILGGEVQVGDVLVELDAETERLQLEEERTRLAALSRQLDALREEITAEEQAWRESRQASSLALDEARARHREAEVLAKFAEEEAERSTRLHEGGHLAEATFSRARTEAQQRRAAADAQRLAVSRLESEQRAGEKSQQARLAQLNREAILLEGEIATTKATIERLEYEIEKRRILAPVAGQLGEVANLRIGTFVREGDKLGTIVPPGELKAIAHFLPPAALGRIRPGQSARLRLEGFPWTQYGSISATVVSVADEPRHGRVRVELALHPHSASPIPLQHGLPGTIEVETDRVSPATLVLRVAGRLLARPGATRRGEVER